MKDIYFDNAATTLKKPPCVIDAIAGALKFCGNPGRGVNEQSLDASRILFNTRKCICNLIGAQDASSIAFALNVTSALNTVIYGLIKPGDEVITTATDHNSVLRPLYRLAGVTNETTIKFKDGIWTNKNFCSKNNIKLNIIEADKNGKLNYSAIKNTLRTGIKAVVINHASNVTGNINKVAEVAQMAHDCGALFVLDAAQTLGEIEIDVNKIGVDVLCFTGHKGLMGPQGTGGLYVRPGISIEPLNVGGSGINTFDNAHPSEMPSSLEAGTQNSHGLAGLCAAIKFIKQVGVSQIHQHNSELLWQFYEGVKNIAGVKVYGDFSTKNRSAICSINIKNLDSAIVSDILSTEYGISTRSGGHCAPLMHQCLGTENSGVVRFSFGYYNTKAEIKHSLQAINRIANEL